MAYTRQNYMEDCFIVKNGGSNEATNAKWRKEMCERGHADRIPLGFPQYRTLDDYEYYENLEKHPPKSNTSWGELLGFLVSMIATMAAIPFVFYFGFKLLKLILDFIFG